MQMPATVAPAFQVEKLDSNKKFKRVKAIRDPDAKEKGQHPIRYETVDCEPGYMVYFPNGHAIHVRTEDELARLGFLERPHKVDMATGEVVPEMDMSPKAKAEQKAGALFQYADDSDMAEVMEEVHGKKGKR